MAEKFDSLMDRQNANCNAFDIFISNYIKGSKINPTSGYLNGHLEGLVDLWKGFRELHVKLLTKSSDTQKLLPYFADNSYARYEDIYYQYYGILKDSLSLLVSKSASCGHNSTKSDFKLPPIDIPKFTGAYTEWCAFRDIFTALVSENQSLTGIQKLHYLKASVSAEAEHLLRSYLMSEANFIPAWEALCQRFDNKRLLVNAQLSMLLNSTAQIKETAVSVRRLYDDTRESLAAIKALGVNCNHWDLPIIHIQVQRLPTESRTKWEQAISLSTDPPTLKAYLEFLEARFRTLEAMDTATNSKNFKPNVRSFVTTQTMKCTFCNDSHHIRQCSSFLKLRTDQRWNSVKSKSLCFNCLSTDHTSPKCPSKRGCNHCGQRHHSLLHHPSKPDTGHSSNTVTSLHVTNHADMVLLSTALIKVQARGSSYILRALIDTGSQASFITTAAMQRLRLKPTPVVATICGLANTSATTAHKLVRFEIHSCNNDTFSTSVEAIVLPTLTEHLPQRKFTLPHYIHLANLTLADPSFNQPGDIDIVLGSEIYPKIIKNGIRTGPSHAPIAQNTVFGWILLGPVAQNDKRSKVILSFFNKLELDAQLRMFWEVEEPETVVELSEDDQTCEDLFMKTHRRKSDGRFEVSLPFKISPEHLGSSLRQATKNLESLERRLSKDSVHKLQYSRCIQEYLTLGHAEKILENELWNLPNFYLPHHGVLKSSSETTKLRVVFNASSKSSSGLSLNDILYRGPSLHQDITTVITRWRLHRYAFSSDMEKMYRQIEVSKHDSDLQRIVWRADPALPLEHYRLRTVTFGVTSAPYLAMRTIRQLVLDDGGNFQMAARILSDQLYVDNILSGADTIDECLQYQKEVVQLLNDGGFKLRQWAANECSLLENIPEADRLISPTVYISGGDSAINMLGLQWNHKEDHLSIKVNLSQDDSTFTKRTILSCISKLYDPLGWCAPVIIRAKIFMKKLWQLGIDWDDRVPDDEIRQFEKLKTAFLGLDQINIPRWMDTTSMSAYELHGFCDSSKEAYAASIYVRVHYPGNNTFHTSFIAAKTRVSPIRKKAKEKLSRKEPEEITLPKLELCGAALLVKLLTKVVHDLSYADKSIYCWCDSTIVLAWLAKPSTHWKTFVANRVSVIQSRLPTAIWNHVSSGDNPADLATRGIDPTTLSTSALWWHGPNWLSADQALWPRHQSFDTSDEKRKIINMKVQVEFEQEFLPLTNYSSYFKLLRVTSYCFRFINNCQRNSNSNSGHLKTHEINSALFFWIRTIQSQHYSADIVALQSKKEISVKSKLSSLKPTIKDDNMLRVGGRLQNSDLPFHEKHPIILPYGHHLSKLIVADAHHQTLHGGLSLTMYHVRQRFWIPKLRSSVKAFIHQCVKCFRQTKATACQLMGNLPKERVTPSRPFTFTGLDYAGPLSIRMSKGRNPKTYKGYIAIFVCFATKAVHLEAVSDLTTESFLAALRRFIARRGLCKEIVSDCGTNFVGAKAVLDKEYSKCIKFSSIAVAEMLANDGINWKFIPPGSPHFGGLWEAGVRSVKHHLRRVVGNHTLTYEELATVLAQIEACLKSRPMCPLRDYPDDFSYLTPGHFLTGNALLAPPQEDWCDVKPSGLRRWHLVQKLQEDFWQKWRNEYLHQLQQRPKWQQVTPNVRVGDLVIIKDKRLPPLKWMMARIIALHPGSDGLVRVVDVKTQNSSFRRPIQKICRLPIDDQYWKSEPVLDL